MWLEAQTIEILRSILKRSPSMYLASKLEGEILWASPAFCEWIGYTLPELVKLTWMDITVNDSDLGYDIEASKQLTDGETHYIIQKRYIPKNGKPVIGHLHVSRYPLTGSIEFCLCSWEPMVNGTAAAFDLAIKVQKEMTASLETLSREMKGISSQTEEERFGLSVIRMAKKYPKISMSIVVVFLALAGFSEIVGTMQKIGLIPQVPIPVKDVDK